MALVLLSSRVADAFASRERSHLMLHYALVFFVVAVIAVVLAVVGLLGSGLGGRVGP